MTGDEWNALIQSKRDWDSIRYPSEAHPPGSHASEVRGVDLALAAGDVAAVVEGFLAQGDLRESEFRLLQSVKRDLERCLPDLTGEASVYFAKALNLLRDVEGARERS